MKPEAIGVAWFRREDYPRILQIMDDAHTFPRTFDEWEKQAERRLAVAQTPPGVPLVRIVVDPQEFTAFCVAHKVNRDAKGRTLFAAMKAEQRSRYDS